MEESCSMKQNLVRKNIGTSATAEEIDSLKILQNRLSCSNQALSIGSIPDNVDQNKVNMFLKAAIESKAESLFLMDNWWKEVLIKYKIESNSHVDLQTGEFYIMEKSE
jgi:hypothetical protein